MNIHAPTPALYISDAARLAITTEALRSVDGLETGGILLGTDVADGITIRHAGDAGPNAIRGECTFSRDLEHAQRISKLAWTEDGSQWIGEWHTHPTGELVPSDVDLRSYQRHLHDPELTFDRFVAIITRPDPVSGIRVLAWLIDRHQAQHVPLTPLVDTSSVLQEPSRNVETFVPSPIDREGKQ